MFFLRSKEIVVDAFTRYEDILKDFPLSNASEFIPEWWKNTPKSELVDDLYESPTLRTCSGVLDLFKKGLIMPLWTDIAVAVKDGEYRWQCADRNTELSIHPSYQWNKFADSEKFGHLKLNSQWVIKTKENIDWMFLEPTWHLGMDKKYTITQGIINAHYVGMPINTQIMVDISADTKFMLKAGQPIAHIIPLSDKKIKVVRHVVDDKEWAKQADFRRTTFTNSYHNKVKKCPFHK